jgi:CRP-like cAMP-binding protein
MASGAPQQSALAPLLAVAKEVSFAKGARLVKQGEAARGAFLIRAGEAEAQVSLPGGGTLAVAAFAPGAMFGEMSLVERGVCSASVMAKTDVAGWFVAREDFRALVASRDPAALQVQRAITRSLAERLRALNATVRGHAAPEDRAAREAPPAGDPLAGVERAARAFPGWRAFLALLPFFEHFDAEGTEALLAIAQVLEVPRGAWLFAQGQNARAAFVVLRGAAEVLSAANGRERRVAICGPGELVGYMALLEGAPHGASARAREAATLLELPRAPLLAIYAGSSPASVGLQHAIQKSLLKALARTNTLLTRLIAHDRLAAAHGKAEELETALAAQLWRQSEQGNPGSPVAAI